MHRRAQIGVAVALVLAVATVWAPSADAKKNRRPTMGPLKAVFTQATFSTTYSIQVSDPDGDRLTYEWRLDPPAIDPNCSQFRVGAVKSTATWFHGDQHHCERTHQDASPVGHPGTVHVAVSDGKYRCETTYFGTETGESRRTVSCGRVEGQGAPSDGLVGQFSKIDQDLTRLIADVRAGKLADYDARALRIDPLEVAWREAFAQFPTLWGCPFANLFSTLVAADKSFEDELDSPEPPYPWLGYGSLFLLYARDRSTDSCSRMPARTRKALDDLATRAEKVSDDADAGLVKGPGLVSQIRSLEADKHALLDSFPDTWDIPFDDLVKRATAMARAALRATTDSDGDVEAAALRDIQRSVKAMVRDLRDAQ